ncbi:MAG TPA: adenine phosphoribosyltransferase [Candidatus Binatia bacterium]|nr:adenine phosphoribosyltransferase [Candidatus Binatia bacterium]
MNRGSATRDTPSPFSNLGGLVDIKSFIRDIPDFPKPGILFKDITPLLANGAAFRQVVDRIAERYRGRVDMVLGIESRGFILGAPVAYALGCGFAIVRKPGKLPADTYAAEYALEYGVDRLEIHRDAFGHPCRVVLVDDLLATGGTSSAAIQLIERLGGEVIECAFVIELTFLNGRQRLNPRSIFSLLQYDGEQ